jgi:hypothetical protein
MHRDIIYSSSQFNDSCFSFILNRKFYKSDKLLVITVAHVLLYMLNMLKFNWKVVFFLLLNRNKTAFFTHVIMRAQNKNYYGRPKNLNIS